MALVDGQSLGRYTIERPLGSGAMGEVHLARDPRIDRHVALKTLRLATVRPGEIEEMSERLLREARAAGRLLHPHIVTLFDAGEQDGLLYLAFEYVPGSDLAVRLRSGPPLALGEALRIARETCEGLDFAHRQGIVHRDVKPSNLLLTADGTVKISDFGIAKLSGESQELTVSGSVMGSPHYLSPEQVRGEPLDGRSDLFSLGIVLYEMIAGRRPFEGETLTTLVYQILQQDPPTLPALRDGLSDVVPSLLARFLAKDRELRVDDAGAAAAAISDLVRDLPAELLAQPAVRPVEATLRLDEPLVASGSAADGARGTAGGPVPPARPPPTPAGAAAAGVASSAAAPPTGDAPPVPPSGGTAAGWSGVGAGAVASSGTYSVAGTRRRPGGSAALLVSTVVVAIAVAGTWWALRSGDGAATGRSVAGREATLITGPAEAMEEGGSVASPPAVAGEEGVAAAGLSAAAAGPTHGGDSAADDVSSRAADPVADRGSPEVGAGERATAAVAAPPSDEAGPTPSLPTGSPAGSATARSAAVEPEAASGSPEAVTGGGDPVAEEATDRPRRRLARPRSLGAAAAADESIASGMRLVFRVQPDDAYVLLDGTVVGQAREFSPQARRTLDLPFEGEHTVVLRRAGLADRVVRVEARADGPAVTPLVGRLLPLAAAETPLHELESHRVGEAIGLDIEPPDAQVLVDGRPVGVASQFPGGRLRRGAWLELPVGMHRLSLVAPGHRRVDLAIDVTSGALEARKRISVVLPPQAPGVER